MQLRNLMALAVTFACSGAAWAGVQTIVDGETRGNGTYRFDLSPGEHLTDAILVYAEPSGTLLLAVYDTAFLQTSAGQALEASLSPLAQVEGDLPNISPSVLLPAPPPSADTAIRIIGYGNYNGTAFANQELATVHTNLASFGFSLEIIGNAGGAVSTETCCKCGVNKTDCKCVSNCKKPFCNCVACSMTCED